MTEYRQRPGRDVWHFHRSCRWWPKGDVAAILAKGTEELTFVTSSEKPTSGELCNECQAKTRRDKA